ncbi:MAG: glucosamine-6-phosphate deaminase [Kiritimatiellia bacterium]|nr:glucosamine-6-phosphate deaminase [Kiritimatiellia bacterium]
MEVILQPNEQQAARLTARLIARQIRRKPDSVLGLATGRTVEPVYDELVRMHREEELDFARCRTFNLDEYVGLAPEDPNSYRATMNRLLFSRVNIDPAHTHVPNGRAENLKIECRSYEDRIADCGGIDLQLLGIGTTGHIGFNDPLSALRSRTRDKTLAPETLEQNAPFFGGDPARMPRRALTMGVGTIMEARSLLMLVTGAKKADILARAVEGPVTASISATAIQFHPDCRVIVDEAGGAKLTGTAYYRWIFENDPDWAEFLE